MFRYKSITAHIISMHIVAIAITSVFMPLSVFLLLQTAAEDLQHKALRENAETIANYLSPGRDGSWTLNLPPSLQAQYLESYGRYAFAVLNDTNEVLFSSKWDGGAIFPDDARASRDSFLEARKMDVVLSGASMPISVGEHRLWIQIAQDPAHRDVLIDDIVRDFFHRVGWVTIPILLLLLAIDVAIFRRALRPLLKASKLAELICPTRTDVRLPLAGMPSEVQPLVRTVNDALERLERGFRVQREFTADAAHELRTPLTILRTRVDTLNDRKIASELRRDIEGMTRIVGQLLDIAQLENLRLGPDESANLKEVCTELAEFVVPLALSEGRDIVLHAPDDPVWIKGNAEAVFRALRNVTENAIKHSPAGTAIDICLTKDGTVSISDRGPGISEEEKTLVFQRFWRKDRRRAVGTGLGLSIVKRIVEAHSGTIIIRNLVPNGAEFSLTFPIVAQDT